jgi:hypothetical protein
VSTLSFSEHDKAKAACPAVRQYHASLVSTFFLQTSRKSWLTRPAEEALEVFVVFASGTLPDEVYVLNEASGKRIAMVPAVLRAKYWKERRPCLS